MKEFDQSKEIVDFKTFQIFFDRYVSDIFANPPNKKPFPDNLPSDPFNSMHYTTEKNPFHTESVRRILKEGVFIKGIPWEDISESIQVLFTMQYDAATINESKRISLEFGNRWMVFRLESSHSYDFVDWQGGYHTGGISLLIHKSQLDEELERIGRKKQNEGEFRTIKSPLVTEIRGNSILEKFLMKGESLTQEDIDFMGKCIEEDVSGIFIQIIPSTLIQLQDVARLLAKQRSIAFVYSD